MPNSIENNAYRTLGLDVNSSQKDILKRYKEIINHLKINDFPSYDLDIQLSKELRTEDSVNDALKKLQNQKNNLKEHFFWFSISDTVDEKALNYLQNNEVAKAIQTWESASNINNSVSLFYKKNLAVLYCLVLSKQHNVDYLKHSVDLWKKIVESEKFWLLFAKKYGANNDLTGSQEGIPEFRKGVDKYISDVYADLYSRHKDSNYVKLFQEIFGTHGDKTKNNLLKPIYAALYENIEKLEKIKIIEDETLSDEHQIHIAEIVKSVLVTIKELHKLGLYDTTESKVVRDHAANSMKMVAVMLYNHANHFEDSSKLMKTSIDICGTDSLKEDLKKQLKIIKSNPEIHCWFCKSLLNGSLDRESSFHEPWYQIVDSDEEGVRYREFTLITPRCHSCKKIHERRVFVLCTRIIGCGILSGTFMYFLSDLGYSWIFAILFFILNYYVLFSFDVGNLKKSENVEPKKYRHQYPLRLELLKNGWEEGEFEGHEQ